MVLLESPKCQICRFCHQEKLHNPRKANIWTQPQNESTENITDKARKVNELFFNLAKYYENNVRNK